MDGFETQKLDRRFLAMGEMINDAFGARATSRAPKYLALHAALSDLVGRGNLRPGDQLPSDDDISARLKLSVGTVQKAMGALRDDGLLERRQGAGTFVVDPSLETHDIWHFRFVGDDDKSLLPINAKALSSRMIRKRGPWSNHMPDVERFVHVARKLRVGGEFYLLSDFYFDGERFADLGEVELREFDRVVLRNILVEKFNVRTKNAKQHLVCAPLTARDARLLSVPAGQTGMILEIYGTDQNARPIFFQRVVIPPTTRKLAVAQEGP